MKKFRLMARRSKEPNLCVGRNNVEILCYLTSRYSQDLRSLLFFNNEDIFNFVFLHLALFPLVFLHYNLYFLIHFETSARCRSTRFILQAGNIVNILHFSDTFATGFLVVFSISLSIQLLLMLIFNFNNFQKY